MAAALVALLAWIVLGGSICSAVGSGIECGWQPMPDGSSSYECIIQIAPELLNSLRRGDSIPLTVDVPDHIRPVSRIRLVAGDAVVPHERLAANIKAWPDAAKKSREGVIETQFTTNSADPRYGNQQATNGAVVPLNNYMSEAQDALARQMQNGGQAVRNAVGQITQDVLPPDPGQSVANAIDNAGQQLGNNLRSASNSVQNDIRQMFGADPAAGNTSAILPSSGQPLTSNNNPQSQQILPSDGRNAGNNRRRLDQPVPATQSNNWQSSQPQANSTHGDSPISPQNNFDSQWARDTSSAVQPSTSPNTVVTQGNDRYTTAPPFTNSAAAILPQGSAPVGSNEVDRYGNRGQSAAANLPTADSRNSALASPQTSSAGPSFPPFTPSAGNEQPITPTPMTSSSTPEIRREMLNQPATAEIQGANGLPIGQQPVSGVPVAGQSPQMPSPTSANSFNWNTKPQTPQTTNSQLAGPTDTGVNNVFPLLLSWVLLSGSGAGNLYLFWSYLDVRNKYRDLVDDASRRISGRRVRD